MNKSFDISGYFIGVLTFIEITRACRRQLVADVLNGNLVLFRFLYEDKNKNVQLLYKKRYELKWPEAHWLKCKVLFDDTEIPVATRREVLKIFLKWYQKFVEAWGYESSRAFFFNAEIESLERNNFSAARNRRRCSMRLCLSFCQQFIFDWLFETVDLMLVFKFVMLVLVIRIGFHVAGCLPAVLFVLWLLFN